MVFIILLLCLTCYRIKLSNISNSPGKLTTDSSSNVIDLSRNSRISLQKLLTGSFHVGAFLFRAFLKFYLLFQAYVLKTSASTRFERRLYYLYLISFPPTVKAYERYYVTWKVNMIKLNYVFYVVVMWKLRNKKKPYRTKKCIYQIILLLMWSYEHPQIFF